MGELQTTNGTTYVKWSNESGNKLVSSGYDGTIRVWNTDTRECIAMNIYPTQMMCTMFMPNDENFVMACGYNETVHIFDCRKHTEIIVPKLPRK